MNTETPQNTTPTDNQPSESDTAAFSPDSDSELCDKIDSVRNWGYVIEAKFAVDKVPNDGLKEAFNWAATYLVEIEARLMKSQKPS